MEAALPLRPKGRSPRARNMMVDQNTDEWLKLRKNYIGSSDAPVIMKVCPFKTADGRKKTPNLLWREKLGLIDLNVRNDRTSYGKHMEEEARIMYEEMTGQEAPPAVVFHPQIDYLMASLDGISEDKKTAVEIKNVNAQDHQLAKEGKIPEHYYPQLQHSLIILNALYGIEVIDYFSYQAHTEDSALVYCPIDGDYINKLALEESKFWDCVMNLEEPELTDDDFVLRDGEWIATASKLFKIKSLIKKLEEKKDKEEKKLKELSEHRNSRGGGFRFVPTPVKGRVDYQSIPILQDMDLEAYRKNTTISWRLKKE